MSDVFFFNWKRHFLLNATQTLILELPARQSITVFKGKKGLLRKTSITSPENAELWSFGDEACKILTRRMTESPKIWAKLLSDDKVAEFVSRLQDYHETHLSFKDLKAPHKRKGKNPLPFGLKISILWLLRKAAGDKSVLANLREFLRSEGEFDLWLRSNCNTDKSIWFLHELNINTETSWSAKLTESLERSVLDLRKGKSFRSKKAADTAKLNTFLAEYETCYRESKLYF